MRKRKTEERIKAIEMHKQGIPRRRIAEELGVPTLSKKPQKSHQKGMELPDPCRYFLCKLCGVLVAYFILS
ncbi:MAG: hypothetical protein ACLUEQ_00710 [Cloacibacillus evryensis]